MAACDYYIAKTMAHVLGGTAIIAGTAYVSQKPSFPVALTEIILLFVSIFAIYSVKNHTISFIIFMFIATLFGHLLVNLFDKLKKQNLLTNVMIYSLGIFAGMTIVGLFDKGNFLKMGKYLFGALIGLLIAHIISLFIPDVESFNADKWLGLTGVVTFAILTSYDIQFLKKKAVLCSSPPNYPQEAMGLFVDLLNIFTHLAKYMQK